MSATINLTEEIAAEIARCTRLGEEYERAGLYWKGEIVRDKIAEAEKHKDATDMRTLLRVLEGLRRCG